MSSRTVFARFVAALSGASVLAGAAVAAVTPVSPGPGAIVSSSHPGFTWSLPPNERSQAIYVADSPDLSPDGRFFDENVVDSAALAADQLQWSPSRPLYAGQYWWLVWSSDRSTAQSFYSFPADFRIAVSLNLFPVKTVRSTFLHLLAVRVGWTANVHALTVRARVLRGKKVVWQQTQPQISKIGFPYSTSFGWYKPRRIAQGTRLRLEVTLRAQGTRRTRLLVVRAP
jgi:hypothetical protein